MANFCSKCGQKLNNEGKCDACYQEKLNNVRSRECAIVLTIFLGFLGIHNFYMGYKARAIIQVLLTSVGWTLFMAGPIISIIWAFVELIIILCNKNYKDARGNILV